ncbi:hypothetical protein [Sedimenticola hydrogenitrophicus]|uniref:hypothetical protein n=1 Tax=Sedimenticola hydrogenitrophicus TaxID=2967975 RepID=UPI0023B1F339|nr:hypothetical protein [Sedimenticola hydrogenitrophicus]
MNQPTKEQWDEVAKEMDRLFGSVYLRCDGYLVSTHLERDSKTNRLYIIVYVDGGFKGEWIEVVDDPEEFSDIPKRFCRHVSRQRRSAKDLKLCEKLYGKRECRKRGYYDRRYLSRADWLKPMPLIRHLKKHNTDIEVLTYETYKAALDAKREAQA